MFTYVCIAGIDTAVYACEGCGSLVLGHSRDLHARLHERIAELERANASA